MTKYISTGGLGDSWIVFLKLANIITDDDEWLHIESNPIVANLCSEWYNYLIQSYTMEFRCDPNYIQNYKDGKWKDYIPVSSGVDDWCPLKGKTNFKLEDPWFIPIAKRNFYEYDVCIQVSAGAKNNRKWRFDPILVAKMLKNEGLSVALVGNEPDYYDKYPDFYNFVGRANLVSSLKIIDNSRLFVGLSGFLNYYACSRKIKNVHLTESDENERRYFHPDWHEHTHGVKLGSLQELMPFFRNLIDEKKNKR